MTESFEHYASKYYDPVKAHEYYMKTRHLKGYDTQGKTLNDEGKQAKAYITKRIREERYSVLKKEQSNRNQKIYSSSVEMTNQIRQLQLQMKQLTPERRRRSVSRFNARSQDCAKTMLERKPIFRRSISSLRRRLVLIIRRLWIVKLINSIPMLR